MKSFRPPRVSQMPSSGWSQCSHSQSMILASSRPALVAGLQAAGVGEVERVQRLAVDVELQLVGGAVADPDRAGAAPALEVVERLLDQVGAAVDPVHDLQRAAAVAARARRPGPAATAPNAAASSM